VVLASLLAYVLPQLHLKLMVLALLAAIETVIILLAFSIYKTKYIVTDNELIIEAARLIGGSKHIRLRDIICVEKTLIPFSIRLFGASFYGGYHYVPGLGKTFIVMTNFKDGVLIRTVHENYIITPRDPEEFIEVVNARRSQVAQT
ncbi:MAG: PH domain-containing protein, partial [Thermoproteota archaeon]